MYEKTELWSWSHAEPSYKFKKTMALIIFKRKNSDQDIKSFIREWPRYQIIHFSCMLSLIHSFASVMNICKYAFTPIYIVQLVMVFNTKNALILVIVQYMPVLASCYWPIAFILVKKSCCQYFFIPSFSLMNNCYNIFISLF